MQQEKARAGRSAACAVRLLSPSALVSAFEKHSIFFCWRQSWIYSFHCHDISLRRLPEVSPSNAFCSRSLTTFTATVFALLEKSLLHFGFTGFRRGRRCSISKETSLVLVRLLLRRDAKTMWRTFSTNAQNKSNTLDVLCLRQIALGSITQLPGLTHSLAHHVQGHATPPFTR